MATIEMYCIYDLSRNDEYKLYNPYYDAWHKPYKMDGYIESSSLMKSDLEALQILMKLYRDKSNSYKRKIDNGEIVIKIVELRIKDNIEKFENYDLTDEKKEWINTLEKKVNLTEFSGNALNYICKNNRKFHDINWDLDFDIEAVLKEVKEVKEEE